MAFVLALVWSLAIAEDVCYEHQHTEDTIDITFHTNPILAAQEDGEWLTSATVVDSVLCLSSLVVEEYLPDLDQPHFILLYDHQDPVVHAVYPIFKEFAQVASQVFPELAVAKYNLLLGGDQYFSTHFPDYSFEHLPVMILLTPTPTELHGFDGPATVRHLLEWVLEITGYGVTFEIHQKIMHLPQQGYHGRIVRFAGGRPAE
eukprot:NODE_5626_length_631_cov_28.265873_g5462_i0.p1 GENE.NODE_5626_length_631_cov_28.265873_g5462_i0~~NODE_5626_length_631_cov_28.265873_g5462_i0.p1  ORF type:complete len:203 (-),score=44.48 NODE_5626_length_631_cov_28.265873_g5462_i0:14-622(-)